MKRFCWATTLAPRATGTKREAENLWTTYHTNVRVAPHRVVSGFVCLILLRTELPPPVIFLVRCLIVYISAPHKVEKWKRLTEECEHEPFDLLYLISIWWSAPAQVALANISPQTSDLTSNCLLAVGKWRRGALESLYISLEKKQNTKTTKQKTQTT